MASAWLDYTTYLPLWISIFRWGMFLILRVLPALFYRVKTEKKRSIEDGPPEYSKQDVTAIIPVYEPPPTFMLTIQTLVKNGMPRILVVADITCHEKVREMVKEYPQVEVIIETLPGKRAAMATGLKYVKTKLTCFVDDDVQWCDTVLEYILHPFNNDATIAGVGCEHRARYSSWYDVQMILADIRLSVRMLELFATSVVDKGASCVSGRTACYKTSFIQEDAFYEKFLNEKFFGMQVVSGDDKFLTRYIMNKNGKIWHQGGKMCYLTTTFERGPRFIKQLLRWSRNTWRSDITCVFIERCVWKNNPFTAVVMLDKFVTPFFLVYGLFYVPISSGIKQNYTVFIGWVIWLIFSRIVRLSYYFVKNPQNVVFIPFFIMFQYLQALIRLLALVTLYERGWGTRNIVFVGNSIAREGITVDAADTDAANATNAANAASSSNAIEATETSVDVQVVEIEIQEDAEVKA
jgi:cellulose synthase/poly-beta-1,6-N-acetylglucosamine synthase-like glycosyltransferase